MRPTPQPKPCALNDAYPGMFCATTPICHSAVDEQPVVPTFPFDQGCVVIHFTSSAPSLNGAPNTSHSPSAKNCPRSCISIYAKPCLTAVSAAVISLGTPLAMSQKLKLYGVRTQIAAYLPGALGR